MPERNVTSWGVMLLSVILAVMFWFFVTWERPVLRTISVPVRCLHYAGGMTCSGAPPFVQAVISGPRLTVALLRPKEMFLDLDLSGVGEGVTVFPALEPLMGLSQELRATRIFPARIEVRLSRSK